MRARKDLDAGVSALLPESRNRRVPPPQSGVVKLPSYEFQAQLDAFCFGTHLTCPEAVEVCVFAKS